MAAAPDYIEKKISREMPLPEPLAYANPDSLFTGRIYRDLVDGRKIEQALRQACVDGDVGKIKEILEKQNIGLKAKMVQGPCGMVLLNKAITWKKPRVLKFLLNEPSMRDLLAEEDTEYGSCGVRALYLALSVVCGHEVRENFANANYEIVFELIKAGVDINHRGYNRTLLMCAWLCGNQEAANRLVLLGADIALSEQCYNEDQAREKASLHNEQRVRQQIALSKQHLSAYLDDNHVTAFGTEIAGLCFAKVTGYGKKDCARISSNIASFLFAPNALIILQAFSASADTEYERLAQQFPAPEPAHLMPIPRTLLFMGNFEKRTRNFENLRRDPVLDEIVWQQWESTYYDKFRSRNPNPKGRPLGSGPRGYGPGAMVVKPQP